MMWILKPIILSLGITLLMELTVGWVWKLRTGWDNLVIVLVNVITNPPLTCGLMICTLFFSQTACLRIEIAAELGVWLLEGFLYQKVLTHCRHPWLFSLTANGASYAAGLLVSHLICF